jgi:hypothetical protein
MIIPLASPSADQPLDFTFVAEADCMYVVLHGVPLARCTYGHCTAYSAGAPHRPLETVCAVHQLVRFGETSTSGGD